jgi:hypothetical protein
MQAALDKLLAALFPGDAAMKSDDGNDTTTAPSTGKAEPQPRAEPTASAPGANKSSVLTGLRDELTRMKRHQADTAETLSNALTQVASALSTLKGAGAGVNAVLRAAGEPDNKDFLAKARAAAQNGKISYRELQIANNAMLYGRAVDESIKSKVLG